jgi:hypothetical protein
MTAADPDMDGDGFNNETDNCPMDSNPSQIDNDDDHFGDICDCDDGASSCTTDCTTDLDGDELPDCRDACLSIDPNNFGLDTFNVIIGKGPEPVGQCTTDPNRSIPCSLGPACQGLDCVNDLDGDGTVMCLDTCLDLDFDDAGIDIGSGWMEPQVVTGPVLDAQSVKVTSDPFSFYMCASVNFSSFFDLECRRSDDQGETWLTLPAVTSGGADQRNPVVVAGDANEVFVVWEDMSSGLPDVVFNVSFDRGLSWSGVQPVIDSPAREEHPAAVLLPSDELLVVWQEDSGGDFDIYSARWNGSSWSTKVPVSDRTIGNQTQPVVAQSSSGSVAVIWRDEDGPDPQLRSARSLDGGVTWEESFLVNDDTGSHDQANPEIASALDGTLVAVWEDSRLGQYKIFTATSHDGGRMWGPNSAIDEFGPGNGQLMPALGINAAGVMRIRGTQDDGGDLNVTTARRHINEFFTFDFQPLHPQNPNAQDTGAIAVQPSGEAVALWINRDSGTFVESTRTGPGCPRGRDCDDNNFYCDLDCFDDDGDGFCFNYDCDDHDSTVSPVSPEVCDFVDNDCNGLVDEGVGTDILFEDMETSAPGWTSYAVSGGSNDWGFYGASLSGTFAPYDFPTTVAGTDGNGGPANDLEHSAFESPPFSTAGFTNVGMTFYSYSFNEGGCVGGGADEERLELTLGGPWVSVLDCPGDFEKGLHKPYSGEFEQIGISLGPASGRPTVRLRFGFDTGDPNGNGIDDGWYVDDVRIYDCAPP